ncbi:MAG: hypothetical protein GF411_20315 [Candidatus Lokiarchaeota archaeon]|nr:hypothetical protein [Candidatus Lokiarchaeota archaeon]
MEKKEIVNRIQTFFQDRVDVILVYLFGSHVTGYTHSESDIDIAVMVKPISTTDAVELIKELTIKLSEVLDECPVDVLILNHTDIQIRFNIIKTGELLINRDERTRIFFEQMTINEYLDTLPLWESYDRVMLERIKEGSFGGR